MGSAAIHIRQNTTDRFVQIIDFETPAENVFQVTWEWKLKPPARKGNRADVMFVINGVLMSVFIDEDPTKFRKNGMIGIQIEGTGKVMRTERGDRLTPARPTMFSMRVRASRGVLA